MGPKIEHRARTNASHLKTLYCNQMHLLRVRSRLYGKKLPLALRLPSSRGHIRRASFAMISSESSIERLHETFLLVSARRVTLLVGLLSLRKGVTLLPGTTFLLFSPCKHTASGYRDKTRANYTSWACAFNSIVANLGSWPAFKGKLFHVNARYSWLE